MKNIFDAIPDNIKSEIFESLVDNANVQIKRIISKGHTSPETGWYDQDHNEWVIVLKGEAVLSFADGSTVNMKAGDYINIAAHQKHKVQWTDPVIETIWLAIHY
jgi:cupin 2 domain-containing protein